MQRGAAVPCGTETNYTCAHTAGPRARAATADLNARATPNENHDAVCTARPRSAADSDALVRTNSGDERIRALVQDGGECSPSQRTRRGVVGARAQRGQPRESDLHAISAGMQKAFTDDNTVHGLHSPCRWRLETSLRLHA